MNEHLSRELLAWLTRAGLAGTPESDIFSVFCDRCVAAGIPLGRAHVAIDTLHPVHEGSLFRWGYPNEPLVHEYGRTSLEGLDVSGAVFLATALERRDRGRVLGITRVARRRYDRLRRDHHPLCR